MPDSEKHADSTMGISLCRSRPDDLVFLYQVYASSRAEEMALLVDWDDAQKEEFLRFQFKAQHTHYQEHYPNARYDLIMQNGEAIGRLYIERMENEIRLMDIALLPQYRNQGIGRALMQDVLDEARDTGKFVSLHVEEVNPARRLYERMGFLVKGDVSFYKLMHWIPVGLNPVYVTGK